MKKLAILGLGHIGSYVLGKLREDKNFNVQGYDLSLGHDLSDIKTLTEVISGVDGVLASTPYFLNKNIAQVCNNLGVDYFDLTESVEVTDFVKQFTNARFVTQCGLAPGMVSIIANHLATDFDTIENIEIRVGALPQNANNHLGYYRTWNTEGLINEYIHPCPAIKNFEFTNLDPVSEFEEIILNGITLEAATTSGGLGSLAETYRGKVKNLNYKTLRYRNHWSLIKFLKDDLGLKDNFDTFVKLFNTHVPQTDKDFVYILINVSGQKGGYKIKQYSKVIESNEFETAIQITTGNGVMSVLDIWAKDSFQNIKGWIKQEDLNYEHLKLSKYSHCYFK